MPQGAVDVSSLEATNFAHRRTRSGKILAAAFHHRAEIDTASIAPNAALAPAIEKCNPSGTESSVAGLKVR